MAKKKDKTEENITAVEEALTNTELFIERNQKILSYVILGIVVVVLFLFALKRFYIDPREKDAQSVMFKAQEYFEKDSLQLALDGDGNYPGFLEIISDYRWTKAARLANYYAGVIYLQQGNFQDAIDHLKKFKSNDYYAANMALAAQGDAYLELGQTGKAINLYLKASRRNVNDFTTPGVLMKAAICYEQLGKWKDAIEVYERIRTGHPDTNEGRDAEKYIARARGMMNK